MSGTWTLSGFSLILTTFVGVDVYNLSMLLSVLLHAVRPIVHKSIHEDFSMGDLAVMEPFPLTTTMHLPKKALR